MEALRKVAARWSVLGFVGAIAALSLVACEEDVPSGDADAGTATDGQVDAKPECCPISGTDCGEMMLGGVRTERGCSGTWDAQWAAYEPYTDAFGCKAYRWRSGYTGPGCNSPPERDAGTDADADAAGDAGDGGVVAADAAVVAP